MKSATTCIAVAVIFACFCSAQAIPQPRQPDIHSADRMATGSERLPSVAWTSLVAWPFASPQPVLVSDGKVHLVYELLVMNVSSSVMTLDRLETLDVRQRLALKTLVMPGGLGSTMKVLVLGKGVGTPALRGCSYRMRVT